MAISSNCSSVRSSLSSDPKARKDISALIKPYPKTSSKQVIVVGASIAGLSAAFSLSLAGFDVLVLDKRTEYHGKQILFMSIDLIKRFYALSNLEKRGIHLNIISPTQIKLVYPTTFTEPSVSDIDLKFFRSLAENKCTICIKVFQEYQFEKLNLLLKEKHFTYPIPVYPKFSFLADKWHQVVLSQPSPMPISFQEKLRQELVPPTDYTKVTLKLKGKIEFQRGPEYEVIDIDGDRQTVTIRGIKERGSQTFSFSHLIAADGSHHSIMKLLAQNPRYCFEKQTLEAPHHNVYGAIHFRFDSTFKAYDFSKNRIINPHLKGCPKFKSEHANILKAHYWNEPYFPFIYAAFNLTDNTGYIVGEIPKTYEVEQDILGLKHPKEFSETKAPKEAQEICQQQRRISEWFQTALECLINIKPIQTVIQTSTFRSQKSAFRKNHYPLGQGGQVILVGDSFIPANFLYGHGAEAAVVDGNVLFDCFDEEGNFNPEPLDQRAIVRFDEYRHYRDLVESSRLSVPAVSGCMPPPSCKDIVECDLCWAEYADKLSSPSFIATWTPTYTKHVLRYAERQTLGWLRSYIQEQEAQCKSKPHSMALIPYRRALTFNFISRKS